MMKATRALDACAHCSVFASLAPAVFVTAVGVMLSRLIEEPHAPFLVAGMGDAVNRTPVLATVRVNQGRRKDGDWLVQIQQKTGRIGVRGGRFRARFLVRFARRFIGQVKRATGAERLQSPLERLGIGAGNLVMASATRSWELRLRIAFSRKVNMVRMFRSMTWLRAGLSWLRSVFMCVFPLDRFFNECRTLLRGLLVGINFHIVAQEAVDFCKLTARKSDAPVTSFFFPFLQLV